MRKQSGVALRVQNDLPERAVVMGNGEDGAAIIEAVGSGLVGRSETPVEVDRLEEDAHALAVVDIGPVRVADYDTDGRVHEVDKRIIALIADVDARLLDIYRRAADARVWFGLVGPNLQCKLGVLPVSSAQPGQKRHRELLSADLLAERVVPAKLREAVPNHIRAREQQLVAESIELAPVVIVRRKARVGVCRPSRQPGLRS